MAFRGDWKAKNNDSLERCWSERRHPALRSPVEPKETGKYEFEGTRGNKINWEMVPMAELAGRARPDPGRLAGDPHGARRRSSTIRTTAGRP